MITCYRNVLKNNQSSFISVTYLLPFPINSTQVKGLSIIEHEKLAVAQRHAAESSNTSADVEGSSKGRGSSNGTVGNSIGSGNMGNVFGNGGGVGNVNDMSEAGEAIMPRNTMKRTPTPVPSPAPAYTVSNLYSSSHYYESLPKKMMR